MLRKIRITLAIISITLLTLLFLHISGVLHQYLGWIANIQFIPALMALNLGIVIALILLTLIFGRVYCSVICPLGIFQDVISHIASKQKKNRFRYSKALSWLRYSFLIVFIIALVAGISSVVSLLSPYSAYGRIASNLFAPLYRCGNNLLAYFAERADSYAFYHVDVWMKSGITLIIAIVTFVIVSVLAWRNGRTYCNTVCPVGTVLGFFSLFSIFRPVLDTNKCNSCGLCSRNCKASCIDSKNHKIDYSRCVTCMDCIDKCSQNAITYRPFFKKSDAMELKPVNEVSSKTDNSRRNFLATSSLLFVGGVLKAQEKAVEGGLAVIEDKKIPKRLTPVVPPGAKGLKNFSQHCTACGLCISACPNDVLRPSNGLLSLMQPEMSYERGYCRPECTVCSDVCPTNAISLLSKEDKSATKIGTAVWIYNNCVVLTDDVECGNCARHCPNNAIEMVFSDTNNPKSRKVPIVNEERCIGCGACENLCPARPFSAIYVEGIEVHRTI